MERIRTLTSADYNAVVADNLRAEMARERWSGRKAAAALGLTPMYVSRRLSGETPLDANDIVMFANFLHVPLSALFENKKGPTPEGAGPRKLPDLDSNQEPAGFGTGRTPIDLSQFRAAHKPAHPPTHQVAAVLPITTAAI